jgi:DnaJ-class molecular chaperone
MDPYQILGVSRDADMAAIKKAYRQRARQFHPDSDPGNPSAERTFKDVAAAYELLSNPGKRIRYDRGEIDASGRPHRGPARPQRDDARSDDTRSDDTRRSSHRQTDHPSDQSATGFKVKGADVTYLMSLTTQEAAKGLTRNIDTVTGKRLAVTVPPNASNGQILRIKGQGMPGMGGRGCGDALVEISVQSDPQFTRNGLDLHADISITLAEAVLGARIAVSTIDGKAMVKVPPGSNTGTVLRLRNKGLPSADGGCGDQYIKLRVCLPSQPDPDLVQFVKLWSLKHPYEVRGS